jgi:hypothetical protein
MREIVAREDLTDAEKLEVERLEAFIAEFEEKHKAKFLRNLSQYERGLVHKGPRCAGRAS